MLSSIKILQNYFFIEDKAEFYRKRFSHNNSCTVVLSVFLAVEQMYYAFFTEQPDYMKEVFLLTSMLMFFYAAVSIWFQVKKPEIIHSGHRFFCVSFGLVGFMVAIFRSAIFPGTTFALPTLYIAVIYGFAILFYRSPAGTIFIYLCNCILMILLLPRLHPSYLTNTYIQDIVTNNIIACMASILSYARFVREFQINQLIKRQNVELLENAESIKTANRELQYISAIDALTDLYNRRTLNEFLSKEYNRERNALAPLSLVLIDIDYFKLINDTYGHSSGDTVLIQMGQILKNNVRKMDIVGRWGGEEFMIICTDSQNEEAFETAERIRRKIEENDFGLGKTVTCSFGVSTLQPGDTITSLIIRADNGLYKAKAQGRNKVAMTCELLKEVY